MMNRRAVDQHVIAGKWSFRVIGTGAEDQGLLFTH
jgi:hypothetical protein